MVGIHDYGKNYQRILEGFKTAYDSGNLEGALRIMETHPEILSSVSNRKLREIEEYRLKDRHQFLMKQFDEGSGLTRAVQGGQD